MTESTARFIAVTAALVVLLAVRVGATTLTVDTTVDGIDDAPGDGVCSSGFDGCTLRAAVLEANALPGADDVVLPAGTYLLTRTGEEDGAFYGDLDVTGDLTITGAGAAVTVVDGNDTSRVFQVIGPRSLALSGITVRHGLYESTFAGGIATSGPLALTDCVVADNQGYQGGGIWAGSAGLTMLRTTVSGNTANVAGGGLAASAATIRDSTFFGNSVAAGSVLAGSDVIASGGGTITVVNSTLDGEIRNLSFCLPPDFNCANGSNIVLANATVGAISLFYGGGSPGSFTLRNTILLSCVTSVISQGYNLIADNHGNNCTVSGTSTGNLINVDPQLGLLADNGGPTKTHALASGSPARNAGNPAVPGSGGTACEATDQRAVSRPQGPGCDIGAFESQCGDGVPQPGEECDDGNATEGDGCDSNCTVSACGNHVVAPGEDCDDGNTAAGDCCSPTCTFDPAGAPCTGDSNVCTDDACDGAGTCTLTENTAPCSDGNACTNGDHCVNGACNAGASCDPCTPCIFSIGCVMPSCTSVEASRASLLLVQGSTDAKDRLKFRWKDGAVDKTAFNDPELFPPRFCLYDQSGGVLMSAAALEDGCDDGSCWDETSKGFKYRDPLLAPDGLFTISLKAGSSGQISVAGRGADLELELPPAAPVKARLISPTRLTCFDASFSSTSSTSRRFKARLP